MMLTITPYLLVPPIQINKQGHNNLHTILNTTLFFTVTKLYISYKPNTLTMYRLNIEIFLLKFQDSHVLKF